MSVELGGTEIVHVRPYARLLTMLGEQLIKNDRIALVELLKNSYDADAAEAVVDFIGFGQTFHPSPLSTIALTDNGHGMSERVIRDHWLNPATAGKLSEKLAQPLTSKGRVMQGEKGIGRFAMFKMASIARVTTRAAGSIDEFLLEFDLSFLDDPLTNSPSRSGENVSPGVDTPEFVDQIQVKLTRRHPQIFDGHNPRGLHSTHGTRIELSRLRSNWTIAAVNRAYAEVARLRPLMPPSHLQAVAPDDDFEVSFVAEGGKLPFKLDDRGGLEHLLEERAVFKVEGIFDSEAANYLFEVNGSGYAVGLDSPEIRGLRTFKKYFQDPKRSRSTQDLECGSFHFGFFVFDLLSTAPDEFRLDKDQKDVVKEHRIYLYRDGVRVQPYGDAQDDWLQLDVIRGTQGADQILSNDQTVGFVYITQQSNPNLKDKTNREGLLENGLAFSDFVAVLQIAVAHIRRTHFAPYLEAQRKKREPPARTKGEVNALLSQLSTIPTLPPAAARLTQRIQGLYLEERALGESQVHRIEDLAGVGLSVESASHDIVASGTRALRLSRVVHAAIQKLLPRRRELEHDAFSLVELIAFISSRLQDIQGLFVSTRQQKRLVNLSDYVGRVQRIYASLLREQGVKVDVSEPYAELMVMSTDAALLQVLINLFDNSLYWLEAANPSVPQIQIVLDSSRKQLVFADNGPGVADRDKDFIFEPFYSGKDDAGKGLGLYIARQVGARSGFSIDLITSEDERILAGANFKVDFAGEGKVDH